MSRETSKQLSVVIASFRNPDVLKLCIQSVQKSLGNRDAEIIVSDGWTQESTEMLMREEFPQMIFLPHKENVGFGGLVNDAIEASSGEYIFLLNPDIILMEDALEKLLQYAQEHDDVGIVSPRLLNFDGSVQETCFRFYKFMTIVYRRTFLRQFGFAKKHLKWFLMSTKDLDNPVEPDWIMGSAYFVSRKAIEKVGVLDRRFFMYFEDTDWCRRFWENGFRVVLFPYARAYHYHGKGSAYGGVLGIFFNKLTRIHIASAIKYFWKYRFKENPHKS